VEAPVRVASFRKSLRGVCRVDLMGDLLEMKV
jgi:hypothetical protein